METIVAIVLAIVLFPIYSVVFDHLVAFFFLMLFDCVLVGMLGITNLWIPAILAGLTTYALDSKLNDWAWKRECKRVFGFVPTSVDQVTSTDSSSRADAGAIFASMIMSRDNSSSRSSIDITIPDAPARSSASDDHDQLVSDAMYKRYHADRARNYNPNSYDAYRKDNLARAAERKAGMR